MTLKDSDNQHIDETDESLLVDKEDVPEQTDEHAPELNLDERVRLLK